MKKHIPFYTILLIIPLMAYLFMASSGGITSVGLTGSPGDGGRTCAECHTSPVTTFNPSLIITTDIPAGGYVPATTYHISLTPSSATALDFGFQITAENAVAAKVGVFVNTDAINTTTNFAGHFVANTFIGHENVTSWNFDWIAPPATSGVVTFYIALIAGSDSSSGGTSAIGTEMKLFTHLVGGVLGINKAQLLNFSMFPNPSDGQVTLQLPSDANQAKVNVFDYLGKTLMQKSINTNNNTIDVSNLSTGVYFVRIQTDNKVGTKKLVVR